MRAGSRRSAIIAAAQRLAVDCGYSGFTVEDLARAVGVSRRTLFNHISSKEEAVLGMLPELTDEQAQTLRDGGPTGHLVDDVLAVTLDCLHADDGTPADETRPLTPETAIGAYKRSKVVAERVVEEMVAPGPPGHPEVPLLVLRPGLAPAAMPEHLTWFKWESYATWLTGVAMLAVLYWAQSELFLIDPAKWALAPWQAILISAASLSVGWLVYTNLCKSRLGETPTLLMLLLFVLVDGWVLIVGSLAASFNAV